MIIEYMDTTINVYNIVNSPFCVDAADGEKIYNLLHKAISEKKHVNLSFKGIELVITAFLNIAVGKLYKDFDDNTIKTYLTKTDLSETFESSWEKVIAGAPIYYSNQKEIERNIDDIIEGEV